ncbi:MAG: ribosomal L7Ae/L30e/S12e/Gadd45 family protein [Nanoarchaeota archaeon]
MSSSRLKKELQDGKAVFGFDKTIKNIKQGKTKVVFLASNCPSDLKYRISLYNVEMVELKEENDAVALICKRPHPVSVVSF